MSIPRHPKAWGRKLLKEADAKGWRVEQGGDGQFKMYCPNPCLCKKTVRATPTGSRYERNLRQQLKAYTCWEDRR